MAAAQALTILDNVVTDHAHDAALADVSISLTDMDRAIYTFDPSRPMRIHGKVSFYKDANARTSHWNVWKERNPQQAGKFTKEEWDLEMDAYGIIGDAVHGASQKNTFFHMGTMQNMVFRHSFAAKLWEDFTAQAQAGHQRRDAMWHEFALLLKNRTVS